MTARDRHFVSKTWKDNAVSVACAVPHLNASKKVLISLPSFQHRATVTVQAESFAPSRVQPEKLYQVERILFLLIADHEWGQRVQVLIEVTRRD